MRFDDIIFCVCELGLEVVMNRVEDVHYPDRATLFDGDWFPVPFHIWLVDEVELDMQFGGRRVRYRFMRVCDEAVITQHMSRRLDRFRDIPLDWRSPRQAIVRRDEGAERNPRPMIIT